MELLARNMAQTSNEQNYDPNIYFDKIFIINLNTSLDRWRKITQNLKKNGIHNFERQQGYRLPRRNPFKTLHPNLYKNLEAYGGKFSNNRDYILNVIGTNLAHFHIIKKSFERGYHRILVLEDDSFIQNNFHQKFREGISSLPNDWDLTFFGFKKSKSNFVARRKNQHIIRPFNQIRGAYGYALNSTIFPFILNNYLFNGMEIDVFFEYILMKKFKVFAFYPQIIGHRDKLESTITRINWINR